MTETTARSASAMTTVACDPPRLARGHQRRATSPVRVARPRAVLRPCGDRRTASAVGAATPALRVRWRRVAALALLVAAAVAVVAVAGRGPVEASAAPGADGTAGPAAAGPFTTERADAGTVLVVGPGETVWDLVAPHVPEGVPRTAYVAEVVAANGVDPLRVAPGTVIRLP